MTDRTSTRLKVECTECDFGTTLVRSAEGEWSADAVADHAERTGHTLRSIPLDD